MSAVIRQLVARKRTAKADAEAFAARRDQIVAEAKGEQGEKGDTGPMPDHEWKGSRLRFQKPDGKWGKFVDLQGPKGEDGKRVVVLGGGGGSRPGLDQLGPGAEGVEPSNIAVMQGGEWVSLPWAAFLSVIAGAVDMTAKMSRRTDFVGESLMYRGEAAPGASESAGVWSIRRIEFAPDGDVTETWAGGSADFVHAWDDRASLIYS